MSMLADNTSKIDPDHLQTSQVVKWPDRHPRSKPRTCTTCGDHARLYTAGPKCDQHQPAAMRKAATS